MGLDHGFFYGSWYIAVKSICPAAPDTRLPPPPTLHLTTTYNALYNALTTTAVKPIPCSASSSICVRISALAALGWDGITYAAFLTK